MPGQLIDVGGHRLHLCCTGSGSPTVVLEPGRGGPPRTWRGSRRPSPATPGSASTTAPAAAGATRPTPPRTAPRSPPTCTRCCDRADVPGPVRAGRALLRRPVRPGLRRPLPRPGRRHGAARLHRTQTRPSPDRQHRPLQSHRSRRRLIGRVRSPRSRTSAQPDLLHNSSATLPGRSPRKILDGQQPCKLR